MSDDFVKLFGSILDSTVWQEPDHVRLVWITMLAMKDHRGIVHASVPGLARRAIVSVPQCEEALQKFRSPDPHSRTKDFEGRRIQDVDGGWYLLNHAKYRDRRDTDAKREADAERKRQERARNLYGMSDVPTSVDKPDMSTMSHEVADPDPDPDPDPDLDRDHASRAQPLTLTGDPPKKPGRKRPARAIPKDWQPDETAKKIARELRLDIEQQAVRFVDWHTAKGTVFADWQAAFRTWLRKSADFMRDRLPPAPTPPAAPVRLAPSTPMQAFDPAEFERVKKGAG